MLEQFALTVSDDFLLRRTAGGDEQAFAVLYQRYEMPLFNYLLRLIHEPAAAEEVLQEVFVAAWDGAARFNGRSQVRTWLFRITHYQAVSWLRAHRPVVELESIPERGAEGEDPERRAIQAWRKDRVHRALDELSVEHRAVVELAFFQNLSYSEIAAIVGCPVGTVKSRMSYARRKLSQVLSDLAEEKDRE